MERRLKRPRDPLQLAKLIGDIATKQVEDKPKSRPKRKLTGDGKGEQRKNE